MSFAKPPSAPTVPMPPPSAHPPVLGSSTDMALKSQKQKAMTSIYTADDTIKTSPQGLKPPTTAKTTLLGQ